MSSKSKSSAPETPKKTSPGTPRDSKARRRTTKSESLSDSPSPLQKSHLSIAYSPRSISSKPTTADRQSPKLSTPPNKPRTRLTKPSEVQAQLNIVQEDLKKAKEQIILIEKEKEKAVDELKQAQRVAEEANEKLKEALVAQKQAEENSKIEKFRAVEMEQAGIDLAQKKEEEWKKEIELVRNQHALDVAALLSATQELQKVKHELAMSFDAKNQALSHADDASKIAEIHADKVEVLSNELTQLKAVVDSKLESEANVTKLVTNLKLEIESLKLELDESKGYKEKLREKEVYMEQLNVELEAAKMAESHARSLVVEWKNRVEELEIQVEKANKMERLASESLDSVMKQLEGSKDLLLDAESEITALKEKMTLLEMTVGKQKDGLEESEHGLDLAKKETSEMLKLVDSLKSELQTIKEEKTQALNNEKLAALSVQTLLEEKNKLINELESSKDEEEKSKKAMESLTSALHEVSAEAKEAKEKLLLGNAEQENYESQIEDLNLVLKATNEKYESVHNEAKHEIHLLASIVGKSKHELENSKAEWEEKEIHLVNSIKQSEEEKSVMEKEINQLVNLLKQTEEESCAMKDEEGRLKDNLKEVESEVIYLQEALGQTKAESMNFKESLLDKENELQSQIEENEELRVREAASVKKIEELSKLLEETLAKNQSEENCELTASEKDYDMLPKVVEFLEENGHNKKEHLNLEHTPLQCEDTKKKNSLEKDNALHDKAAQIGLKMFENVNGKQEEDEKKQKQDDTVEVEYKTWESCKIEKKEFSPERETEQGSRDEEGKSKAERGKSFDQTYGVISTENTDDGGNSPSKHQKEKKKPLLRKFGNLLKRKSTGSTK